MNKTAILFFMTVVTLSVSAQSKYIRRLTFDRMGLMFETGKEEGPDPNTKQNVVSGLGNSLGLQINVNPSYLGQDDNQKFILGWSLNLEMGYNITNKNVAPYVLDIGFWNGYLINEDFEIGAQYCFLGVYSYQTLAHFGASFSPAIRYKRFQLTGIRRGAGAIRGCFFPKDPDNNFPQHSLELMYNLGENFLIGVRNTKYHPMNDERTVREWRISIAITSLQENFKRGKTLK